MFLTQLKTEEELADLPFSHLIKADQTESTTYLIKDSQQTIGFIHLNIVEQQIFKLEKFVIYKPNQSEQIIEIFYHILEMVKKKGAHHLLIETEQEALIELLNWLGFKRWPETLNTFGYTYG
ncbi:hypothetical protein ACS127_08125 [Amphibacillus sp. Q70]|uniref:hypothetical protein n=1 Tax=Amphibacillus sp. Q70 TaxID=3453416 RepID=UPI003F86FB4A